MNHHHPGDCATYLRASGWTCLPPEHQQSARAAADPELSLEAKGLYLMLLHGEDSGELNDLKVSNCWNELLEAGYVEEEGE